MRMRGRQGRTASLVGHGCELTKAFTFLETVIGIALFSMILVASGQILYSLTQALFIVQTEPRNTNHADTVASFLDYAFQQCVERFASRADAPLWGTPPGMSSETLYFQLAGGHPFFVSSVQPAPNVRAYLIAPKEGGLEIVWTSDSQTQAADQPQRGNRPANTTTVQRLQLSPYVVDMEYSRGEDDWEFVSAKESDAVRRDWKLEGLRLTFEIKGREETRYIRLGPRLGKVLLF
jgi:hypothetical protein